MGPPGQLYSTTQVQPAPNNPPKAPRPALCVQSTQLPRSERFLGVNVGLAFVQATRCRNAAPTAAGGEEALPQREGEMKVKKGMRLFLT